VAPELTQGRGCVSCQGKRGVDKNQGAEQLPTEGQTGLQQKRRKNAFEHQKGDPKKTLSVPTLEQPEKTKTCLGG